MKMLMMGNKESGKTTYMASAFGLLEDGQNGFFIKTDSSSTQWFRALFKSIKAGFYPSLSDKRNSYEFELYHYQKKVLDFEWIDYYGGVIAEANANKLSEDIDSSDGVILFLEASALLNKNNTVTQFRRILALITQKLTKLEHLFTVIIVITKYDMIPDYVPFSQIQAPLDNFLSTAANNDNIYTCVVPVSCTGKGFFNVELPLLDMLDSGLKIEYIKVANEAKRLAEEAQDYASKIGVFDWIYSKLNGMATNGEMAESYIKKAQDKIELFKSLKGPMKSLSDFVRDYEIVLPKASDPQANSHTSQYKRHRMLEF